MTANDFINGALRLINVLASGETPSAAEASDALSILNIMMDAWNAERLMVFTILRTVFTPLTLKQAYTVGPGGDINITRPARIDRVGFISLQNATQPAELPIELVTDVGWEGIPVKNISSSYPQKVWNDLGFPLMTLSFWPIPNVNLMFTLYSWSALTQFADLVTDYEFPPAYQLAIKYNLALMLAPEFGVQQLNPLVSNQAAMSKGTIKSMNILPLDLKVDPALSAGTGPRYNIYTDQIGPGGSGRV